MPFKCPQWNVENQRFDFLYDAQTVNFQSCVLARALLDTIIGKSNNIVVALGENLSEWNEMISRSFHEKLQNAEFLQFFFLPVGIRLNINPSSSGAVADSFLLLVLDQECELQTIRHSCSFGRGTPFWTSHINSTRTFRMIHTGTVVSSIEIELQRQYSGSPLLSSNPHGIGRL